MAVEGMSWNWSSLEAESLPAVSRPHVSLTGLLLYDNASGNALEVPYGCDEHLQLLQLLDRSLLESSESTSLMAASLATPSSATSPGGSFFGVSPRLSMLPPAALRLATSLGSAVQGFLSRGFPTSDVDLAVGDAEYEEHAQVRAYERERVV
jgi:hypothetical protein